VTLDTRPQTQTGSTRPIGLRAQSTAAGNGTGNEEVKLDWDSFFKLRASRRRYSLASSIATAAVSTTAGVQILSAQDLESLGAQVMGLDPFVVLGLATAGCGAIGWLLGPMVGNGLWGLVYRKYKPSVATVSNCEPKAMGWDGFLESLLMCYVLSPERERVLRSHSSLPC
jgi:import inner membrane translocase subunit TIM23